MLRSIIEGDSTFTRLRIENAFRDQFRTRLPGERQGLMSQFTVHNAKSSNKRNIFGYLSAIERRQEARGWCLRLHAELKNAHASHLEVLDSVYSELLECHFNPEGFEETEYIVQGVCNVLNRLPETVPEIHDRLVDVSYAQLPKEFYLIDGSREWANLRASHFISRNIVLLSLKIQTSSADSLPDFIVEAYVFIDNFKDLANATMEVLESAIELSTEQRSPEWFLIKTFLWTSWQRAATLYHYAVLQRTLRFGYREAADGTTSLDGHEVIQKLFTPTESKRRQRVLEFMCKWALTMLQANKSSVGQDYRRVFGRFSHSFGNEVPRCIVPDDGSPTSCDGKQPAQCLRFSRMVIHNQSAHAKGCNAKCPRLYWDEVSWKKIGGRAAVQLEFPDDGLLKYCEASEHTMAVSHVWSHGQGGRSENKNMLKEGTGLNSCLHRRYLKIAKSHACNSYWMDTPCIPSDHGLRGQAVANINRIFAESKLTLVCDRNIIAINAGTLDMTTRESLLATILVCDWNVRAWTLLEALRGRKNVHMLCKDDLTISLKEVIHAVYSEGCIDIAAVFLSAQHLLPSYADVGDGNVEDGELQEWDWVQQQKWVITGRRDFFSLGGAAQLLSHRHASRPGDEIVIWCLLNGDNVFMTAEDFWRSQENEKVPSGFLVSSLPRLSGAKGLSWAPCRPNFSLLGPDLQLNHDDYLFPYIADDTSPGQITKEGYWATWWACEFEAQEVIGQKTSSLLNPVERAAVEYLKKQSWCAFLQPLNYSRDGAVPHQQKLDKEIFIIVGSDDRHIWTWLGILQMDKDVFLPEFSPKQLLIA